MNLINLNNNNLIMSSKQIAELTGISQQVKWSSELIEKLQ